jgi:type I restriction enzyme R subunit
MADPEARAREEIDRQLDLAGWVVQDRARLNLSAGEGVAIREVSIPGAGEADYLLVAALDEFAFIAEDLEPTA